MQQQLVQQKSAVAAAAGVLAQSIAAQAMLDEFRRELDALRQREDRILKLCSRQQATVTLKNREFTEAVVHLIQQCL